MLTAAGTVLGSRPSFFVGLMVVALAVRYRKNPAAWEYICFISLALAMVAWMYSSESPPSPLVGTIPLMLSYLLDYLDERRQRRSASAEGPLNEKAGNGRGLAEQPAASMNAPRILDPGGILVSPEQVFDGQGEVEFVSDHEMTWK